MENRFRMRILLFAVFNETRFSFTKKGKSSNIEFIEFKYNF